MGLLTDLPRLAGLRQDAGRPDLWKLHVLAELKAPACLVCKQSSEELNRHFFWFVNEQYYEVETIVGMQRSYGFCPVHTRHFLQTQATSQITTVFLYLTQHTLRCLRQAEEILGQDGLRREPRERCRKVAEILRPKGICRTCRDQEWWDNHAITTLIQALSDPEVQRAYCRSPGLCLPHFRKAALAADWDSVSFLVAGTNQRVREIYEGSTGFSLEQIAGLDKEGSLRRMEPKPKPPELPTSEEQIYTLSSPEKRNSHAIFWSPTFGRVRAMLAETGCPVCKACERGVKEYLAWLSQEMETKALSSRNWDMAWRICPSHLWDLQEFGYKRAAAINAQLTLQEWLSKVDTLAAGLAKRPSDRFLRRLMEAYAVWKQEARAATEDILDRRDNPRKAVAEALQSPQYKLDSLRTVGLREDQCQACWHSHETARRTLDLILRVVEDPAGRQSYHQGWGLCLRHCILASRRAEVPNALAEIIKAQIVRLRLLEWELEEASRKMNWSVRYEPSGPEESAWRRAAYQFCGSTFWDS